LAIVAHAVFLIFAAVLALAVGSLLWRHGDGLQAALEDRGESRGRLRTLTGLTVLSSGLVAVGAAALLQMVGDLPETPLEAALFVGLRLGAFLIVLGVTHLKGLSVLTRAAGAGAAAGPVARSEPGRPRRAREDPFDRVLEAARLDAPSGL